VFHGNLSNCSHQNGLTRVPHPVLHNKTSGQLETLLSCCFSVASLACKLTEIKRMLMSLFKLSCACRRGSSAATSAGRLSEASSKTRLHSTPLKRGSSVASTLTRGSSVAAVSPNSRSSNSSPDRWSEPGPGWGGSPGSPPLARRSSVTFSSEVRRGVRLSPLSPRRTGSGVPLVRGASGALQRSPNR